MYECHAVSDRGVCDGPEDHLLLSLTFLIIRLIVKCVCLFLLLVQLLMVLSSENVD